MIKTIVKRDGREAEFDVVKISNAIYKAAEALGGTDHSMADELAEQVVDYVENCLGVERPCLLYTSYDKDVRPGQYLSCDGL